MFFWWLASTMSGVQGTRSGGSTWLCVFVCAQGVKEVTLLGQNVNSYRDLSEQQFSGSGSSLQQLSRGFQTVYRTRPGGLRFSHLLDRVSRIDPDMRIRFSSPHPKDFPDEVRGSTTREWIRQANKLPDWKCYWSHQDHALWQQNFADRLFIPSCVKMFVFEKKANPGPLIY